MKIIFVCLALLASTLQGMSVEELNQMSLGDGLWFYETLTPTQKNYFNFLQKNDKGSLGTVFDLLHQQTRKEQLATLEKQLKKAKASYDHWGRDIIAAVKKEIIDKLEEEQRAQQKLYHLLYNAANEGDYQNTKKLAAQTEIKSDPKNIFYMLCYLQWHEDEEKQLEIMELFLERGKNINELHSFNDEKRTVLDRLTLEADRYYTTYNTKRHKKIIKFLKEHGAQHHNLTLDDKYL